MRRANEHVDDVSPGAAPPADPTVQQALGIVMAVHHIGADGAWKILCETCRVHEVRLPALALATVELVQGLVPQDPAVSRVCLQAVMGRAAFARPVLDGQVHASLDVRRLDITDVDRLLAAAEARDRAAEARDGRARARDEDPDDSLSLEQAQRRARADREQAALDRIWAGRDRDRAAEDRADLLEHLRHSED